MVLKVYVVMVVVVVVVVVFVVVVVVVVVVFVIVTWKCDAPGWNMMFGEVFLRFPHQ